MNMSLRIISKPNNHVQKSPQTSSFEIKTQVRPAPILTGTARNSDRHPPSHVSPLPISPSFCQTIPQTLLLPLPMTPLLVVLPDPQGFPQLLALLNLRRR